MSNGGGNGTGGTDPIAGVVAVTTALLAGVGALTLTGSLGRVQRNHAALFAIAVGAVVFASGLWAIAAFSKREGHSMGIFATVLAALGVIGAISLAVFTAHEVERPSLRVKLDEGTLALSGAAKVGDLASHERLVVFVDGLRAGADGYEPVQRLYQSYQGPDTNGSAVDDIDVQLPPGRFDAVQVKAFTGSRASACDRTAPAPAPTATPKGDLASETNDEATDPGCVVLTLPRRPHRPALTAQWSGSGSHATVRVTIDATDIGVGDAKDDLVAVAIVGRTRRHHFLPLYRSFVEPGESGAAKRQLVIPVPPVFRMVCAEAQYVAPGGRMPHVVCPLRASQPPPVAAAQLRVPRS